MPFLTFTGNNMMSFIKYQLLQNGITIAILIHYPRDYKYIKRLKKGFYRRKKMLKSISLGMGL